MNLLFTNHQFIPNKQHNNCKNISQIYIGHNFLTINILQNLLFCIPKAAVLYGKSVGFAMQNSYFRNAKIKLPFFFGTIFTKQGCFLMLFCKILLSGKPFPHIKVKG